MLKNLHALRVALTFKGIYEKYIYMKCHIIKEYRINVVLINKYKSYVEQLTKYAS